VSHAIRVIACLDVDGGRVVKGVGFSDLRDAGEPVERARHYDAAGADEIVILDITASADARETTYDMVRRTAEQVFIPLTVGGGVRAVADVDLLLRAGADKVSVGTAAVLRPELVGEIADRFGSQVLVVSVDARRSAGTPSGFEVTTHGGRRSTGLDALTYVDQVCGRGAGEILLNSMDADGSGAGFDLGMVKVVREATTVPLVASGGAGTADHFAPAVAAGADAVLAAGIFHRGEVSVAEVKAALTAAGHRVRPPALAGQ
jgi:cyclase